MKYDTLAAFCAEPLLILREELDAMVVGDQEHRKDRRQRQHEAFRAAVQELHPSAAVRTDGTIMAGRVAVVPVFGVIDQRAGFWSDVSTEALGATIDSLVADKQVRSIVMVYDTPGGSVAGVPELGEKIRAARDSKRIVGMADPMAASAGLWLISQSSEVVVSPSGQIGSHGVVSMHVDASKMYERLGVNVSLITSSPFKAEGHPFAPLGEEARGERQAKVNHYHAMFTASLAKGRGMTEHKVEKGFGGGRMLTPEAAKAAGMVDRVGTLADVLHRLGEGDRSARAQAEVDVRARMVAIQESV